MSTTKALLRYGGRRAGLRLDLNGDATKLAFDDEGLGRICVGANWSFGVRPIPFDLHIGCVQDLERVLALRDVRKVESSSSWVRLCLARERVIVCVMQLQLRRVDGPPRL